MIENWNGVGPDNWNGTAQPGDLILPSASNLAHRQGSESSAVSEAIRQIEYMQTRGAEIQELYLDGQHYNAGLALMQGRFGGEEGDTGQTPSERGTTIHERIENFMKGGHDEPRGDHTDAYMYWFLAWYSQCSPSTMFTEAAMFNPELGCAATVDWVGNVIWPAKDRTVTAVIDWKTSTRKPSDAYASQRAVQLATGMSCTHMITEHMPRLLAVGGRKYLISPQEMHLAVDVTQKMKAVEMAFIVSIWPEGVKMYPFVFDGKHEEVTARALDTYWWQERDAVKFKKRGSWEATDA